MHSKNDNARKSVFSDKNSFLLKFGRALSQLGRFVPFHFKVLCSYFSIPLILNRNRTKQLLSCVINAFVFEVRCRESSSLEKVIHLVESAVLHFVVAQKYSISNVKYLAVQELSKKLCKSSSSFRLKNFSPWGKQLNLTLFLSVPVLVKKHFIITSFWNFWSSFLMWNVNRRKDHICTDFNLVHFHGLYPKWNENGARLNSWSPEGTQTIHDILVSTAI